MSQASRRKFLNSRKILRSLQLSKSRFPSCCPDGPKKHIRPLVFEKIFNNSADTVSEDSTQPFGCEGNIVRKRRMKFNEETHEACYGSRLLFAVLTLPREL